MSDQNRTVPLSLRPPESLFKRMRDMIANSLPQGEIRDDVDGCKIGLSLDGLATPDDDVDGFVLFADVDPHDSEAVTARQQAWQELLGAEA